MNERKPKMSSVLGASGVVLGDISGEGDLEIRGKVQGKVELAGRVLVTSTGTVLGGIEAIELHIAGRVQGNVVASDQLTVAPSGQIIGDLSAPRVAIEAGARIRGALSSGQSLAEVDARAERVVSPSRPKQPPRTTRAGFSRAGSKGSSSSPTVSTSTATANAALAPTTAGGATATQADGRDPSADRSPTAPSATGQKGRPRRAGRKSPRPGKLPMFKKGARGQQRPAR